MNRIITRTIACSLFLMPVTAVAEDNLGLPDLSSFYGKPGSLSERELSQLHLSEKWLNPPSDMQVKPVQGSNGQILFPYGVLQPTVICATLQITDIALQPGEKVNSVHSGDTARWSIEPAVTGTGEKTVQHIIVKPMEAGIQTSLMVATDRRTYHLQLKSRRNEYMPRVAFIYQEDLNARFAALSAQKEKEKRMNTLPSGEYLGNLDFNYTVTGDAPWKPLRVFNDGTKTIIQMPDAMKGTEAPTFLAVQDGQELMVNYRLQGDRFIIDSLFERGMLIAGVGSKQTRITITRGRHG